MAVSILSSIVNGISFILSSWEISVLLLTFLLTLIYQKFLRRDPRIRKALKDFPGPPTLPILGNALLFNVPHTELVNTTRSLVEKYGNVIQLWMFNLPYVLIANAKEAEVILSSPVHIERSRDYDVMRSWLGNALGLSGGELWVKRRKFLTPAFTFGLQDEFLQVFNEQGHILKKVVEEECLDKGVVNMYPYCFRYSLDVICEAAMGTKIYAQTLKNVEYLNSILKLTGLIAKRILRPWLQLNFIWKLTPDSRLESKYLQVLHGFTDNVIQERRQKLIDNPEITRKMEGEFKKKRLAFLDLLLQAQMQGSGGGRDHVLTDMEIRNETDLFMAAGHDTSGGALAWTLFLLALHPQIQRKVQEELDQIFADDPEREVTNEDLTKMQYLEMCFKESLRLRPPIPVIFRALHDDLPLGDGRVLPRGTSVAISFMDIHMDPKIYPDPEKFIPERFSPENCATRSSYAFVPFAAGPRSCLGQRFAKIQGKISLSTLLRNFWFEAEESWESVKIVPDVNLRPVNGLHFSVHRRNKNN